MAIVVEAVPVGDLSLDAANGEVHLGEPPRRVVRFLAADRDVGLGRYSIAVSGSMGADELDRLHKHAGRAATGVVNSALIGFQHLDQELDNTARGVELATLLALSTGKLGQEILVDATEHVLGAGGLIAHLDVADQIDELAEPLLVQRRAGVVLG